jgi:hypothetical protein
MPITRLEEVHESRLTWPENKPRAGGRVGSPFRTEVDKAEREIKYELERWGARDYIISRNRTRIFAGDPAAAVWWLDRKRQLKVIGCDKYVKPADNLHAIYLTLDAMRALDRWGAYTIEQASEGAKVAMLPPPAGSEQLSWRIVLGDVPINLTPDDRLAILEKRYRNKASEAGHDNEPVLRRLIAAIEAARQELKGNG